MLTARRIGLATFACVFLVAFFSVATGGVPLLDWDEINFAENAREMLLTGDFLRVQINFEPFHEKPPLFFWLQVVAMKWFGVGEYAARFPNAVCGAITLILVYFRGRRLKSQELGVVWASVLIGTFLPHFYFKTGIIDPWYNLFIYLAVLGLFELVEAARAGLSLTGWVGLAGVAAGLSVLTKGPVSLGLIALTGLGFFVSEKLWRLPGRVIFRLGLGLSGFSFISLALGFSWHAWIASQSGGGDLIQEFIDYQLRLLQTGDAGHGQPWFYHPLVLLLGCFPASAFLWERLKSPGDTPETRRLEAFDRLMWIHAGVVVIVFSLVRTKIVHYSSAAWLPITFLAAHRISVGLARGDVFRRVRFWVPLLSLPLGMAAIALPVAGLNPERVLPWIRDPFAQACFSGAQPWQGWEYAIGSIWLVAVLGLSWAARRTGWCRIKLISLLAATALFTLCVHAILLPRLERYTQGPYIDFLRQHQGQRMEVAGFKSFAHLFYADRMPLQKNEPVAWVISRSTREDLRAGAAEVVDLGCFQAVRK